ncbi:putative phage baseplate protein [Escherichia coli]|uniref:hypothetical protein n=1 Tax=Escherichia coli TaxID=562 RepID=UPI000DFBCB82|nr:hypothetical protein [Escherichia coli]STM70657.1 putative phage baseplate protein [Escherichia coli]
MADSEFQRPTLAENISMLRNDLFARLDVSDTLRRMDEDVRAKVYAAAAAYGLRLHRLSGNEHAA